MANKVEYNSKRAGAISRPVCDLMWICRALSLPSILRQRRHRCLKIDDDESSPAISAALSDGRITVTLGALPTASQPTFAIRLQHLYRVY